MNYVISKFNSLRSSGFVRNVVTLQTGSFFANIFQAVVGILLARLLQPEFFGVYALAFGIASVASLVVGVGIQEATSSLLGGAYSRGDKNEVSDILGFMFKITSVAVLIVLPFVALLPKISSVLYGDSSIGKYASIVVMAVILSSFLFTLLYTSFQVTRCIKSLTILIVSDQILRFGLSLALVGLGYGIAGAMFGHLLGAIIVFLASMVAFNKVRFTILL